MKRRRAKSLIMAFRGAMAATSVQRCVWMWSRRQVWWDCDVNGFNDTAFIQKFQDVKGHFQLHLSAPLYKTLAAGHSPQETHFQWKSASASGCIGW